MKKAIVLTKKDIYSNVVVIILALLSAAIIHSVNSLVVHIAVIWIYCIAVILLSGLNIMHPYTWFSAILTLYSSAYAILLSMGISGNYSYQQLLYPVIAMDTAMIIIGPQTKENADYHFLGERGKDVVNYKYLDTIIVILFLACLVVSMQLLRSGYSGKSEMKQANNIYYRAGVYFVRYLTILTIIRVCNCIRMNKKFVRNFVLTGVATLAFTLSTGERDSFIRFCIVVLLILYSAGIIKKRHFLILIPASMVLLTLSVEFKYYFLRGTLRGSFSLSNLVEGFLTSDFSAAGRNLQYLIDRPWTEGTFGFPMLFTELFYPFLPGSMKVNPDRWFNYVVHTGNYHGNAFTLVGTGYIISGIAGIIVVFAIVGLFVRWIYNRSERNIFYYSAYIYIITIIMISMRGSLSSIVSCLVKEVAVCFLFCYAANQIISNSHRAKL